jgi:antirestriction protein ArdC
MSNDLHSDITSQLVAAIEANPSAPGLPWHVNGPLRLPANARTGRPYSGINVLTLWVAAARHGYLHPVWATYKQWAELGAQVRRGERGTTIVFYLEYEPASSPLDPTPDPRRVLRASSVFCADQLSGVVPPTSPLPLEASGAGTVSHLETFVHNTRADVRERGDGGAYYNRSGDCISMPPRESFVGTSTMTPTESFYGVLAHELCHWTGAPHRLDRKFGDRFGDERYAVEELVAEIGSAFLCAELGITLALRPDHAKYLSSWLRILKSDSRAIFTAASQASLAVGYLKALQLSSDHSANASLLHLPASAALA